MPQTNFIVREPLLDPKQRVIGYELSWKLDDRQPVTAAALEALVGFVAEHLIDAQRRWLLRDKILFLDAVPSLLSTEALHAMPPERMVLTMTAADMADPDTLSAVQ